MTEISALEMNRLEKEIDLALRNRNRWVAVETDVFLRLVELAKERRGGGYTVTYPISVTSPTLLGETQITPAKLFSGTKNV